MAQPVPVNLLHMQHECVMDAFVSVDMKGGIMQFNENFRAMLGYEKEELLSMTYEDLTPETWHAYEAEIMRDQVILNGFSEFYEKEYRCKDGTILPVETRICLCRDATGNPSGIWASVRDITERKQIENELFTAHQELELRVAERTDELTRMVGHLKEEISARKVSEEALHKSNERYMLAVHGANDGIWDWNLETDETYVSPRWKSMLGYGDDEIQDVVTGWKQLIHPDDLQRSLDTLQDYLDGNIQEYRLEYRLRHKDGSYRWILARGACLRDQNGKPYRLAGSHTDITGRKLAKQVLEAEAIERLKVAEELRIKDRIMMQQSRQAAMGEMVSNIAHQWRQPLNTLGLIVQNISLFYGSEEFNKEFIDSSTDKAMKLIMHMSQTIDDFRNFFKPDKALVLFSANKIIKQTISLVEDSFKTQQITLISHSQGELKINGYPNEYSQVLLNILLNAKDAFAGSNNSAAHIKIQAYAEEEKVVVTITDNAGGIAEDIKDKIFDPYFTTKGPNKGTGIGLFMAKIIIEQNMGGRLLAYNTEDGAEFRIEV